jgi:hypothetical protein
VPDANLHKPWLAFARKVMAVTESYSKDQLWALRNRALLEMPSMVPVIEAYLNMAERWESEGFPPAEPMNPSRLPKVHLFDLLREEKFFPQNLDLAKFASRVLPKLRAFRFDKMSRTDIAGRIIEHIEKSDPEKRKRLEKSMREALTALSNKPDKTSRKDIDTFLSRWERIIKGVDP